jgi:DNA repair protein RecO (recombination protein O)
MFKNSMTMFMSEVLYRVVKDGAYEQGLFEWCEKDILLLDAIQTDFSNFHIRFLLELTVALGFSPESQDLMPFVGEHYPAVEKFMTLPFADSMLIPLNGAARNEIAEEILRYIEYHTESSVNVNSLKVLRELFA